MIKIITYQEWVVDVCEDGIFRDDVIYLSKLYDIGLLKSLHREELSRLLILC